MGYPSSDEEGAEEDDSWKFVYEDDKDDEDEDDENKDDE